VRSRSSDGSVGVSFDLIISFLLPLSTIQSVPPRIGDEWDEKEGTGRTLDLPSVLQSPTFELLSHVE
jgi:hypothetical protein